MSSTQRKPLKREARVRESLKGELSRARVLIVEDCRIETMLYEAWLKELGLAAIDIALDCAQAIRYLYAYRYDLVILDVLLPDGNGLSLAHEVQRSQREKDFMMIVMSNYLCPKRIQVYGHLFHMSAYLAKPFSKRKLQNLVKNFLVSCDLSNGKNSFL